MSEVAINWTGETIIRKAVPADVLGITDLGIEALESDPYEGLVISRANVAAMARDCISNPSNFCWVAERDGEIVGAVTAIVGPMPNYERNMATVAQFYCKVPPTSLLGYGMKMLTELRRWVKGRHGIKAIVFTLDYNADPRIGKLLVRLGMTKVLPIYMEVM